MKHLSVPLACAALLALCFASPLVALGGAAALLVVWRIER
jgi:hypothetical protein